MTIRRTSKTPRPLRGTPEETRTRLVAAAAQVFNRSGYHGTDSNRIARAAGYSPGTFYKHFADKREIFLAAFQEWVDQEWKAIEREVAVARDPEALARRIVELTLRLHLRWRGLRASMLALVGSEPVVRRFHRAQRRRQLGVLAALRKRRRVPPRPPEEDLVLLFTMERTCDAVALGELRDLGLSRRAVVEALCATVRRHVF
ncbi:MAG TPA: TetR/AcrR family transcriptional regulator [Myxococcota bacterium]|nr:TetR/AcrR family transcriptional regulator [Myxococcota bacterium]